jgi:hypothetical protein
MNLDITLESLAKRYRPDTEEWKRASVLLAKRFTRAQLSKKKLELDDVVRVMAGLIQESGTTNPETKETFDTTYRKLELVTDARQRTYRPLHRRWT